MKKAYTAALWLLLALTVFYPLALLFAAVFGYSFTLTSPTAYAAALAVLSVCVFYLTLTVGKDGHGVALLLAPISMINAIVLFINAADSLGVIFTAASAIFCVIITAVGGRRRGKTASLVVSGLLLLPAALIGFTALIFAGFGADTVVQSVPSPGGEYRAELIDSDDGALGGGTYVYVHEGRLFNTGVFTLEKKPQCVYSGDWGEFVDMELYWQSDTCLVINGNPIRIS